MPTRIKSKTGIFSAQEPEPYERQKPRSPRDGISNLTSIPIRSDITDVADLGKNTFSRKCQIIELQDPEVRIDLNPVEPRPNPVSVTPGLVKQLFSSAMGERHRAARRRPCNGLGNVADILEQHDDGWVTIAGLICDNPDQVYAVGQGAIAGADQINPTILSSVSDGLSALQHGHDQISEIRSRLHSVNKNVQESGIDVVDKAIRHRDLLQCQSAITKAKAVAEYYNSMLDIINSVRALVHDNKLEPAACLLSSIKFRPVNSSKIDSVIVADLAFLKQAVLDRTTNMHNQWLTEIHLLEDGAAPHGSANASISVKEYERCKIIYNLLGRRGDFVAVQDAARRCHLLAILESFSTSKNSSPELALAIRQLKNFFNVESRLERDIKLSQLNHFWELTISAFKIHIANMFLSNDQSTDIVDVIHTFSAFIDDCKESTRVECGQWTSFLNSHATKLVCVVLQGFKWRVSAIVEKGADKKVSDPDLSISSTATGATSVAIKCHRLSRLLISQFNKLCGAVPEARTNVRQCIDSTMALLFRQLWESSPKSRADVVAILPTITDIEFFMEETPIMMRNAPGYCEAEPDRSTTVSMQTLDRLRALHIGKLRTAVLDRIDHFFAGWVKTFDWSFQPLSDDWCSNEMIAMALWMSALMEYLSKRGNDLSGDIMRAVVDQIQGQMTVMLLSPSHFTDRGLEQIDLCLYHIEQVLDSLFEGRLRDRLQKPRQVVNWLLSGKPKDMIGLDQETIDLLPLWTPYEIFKLLKIYHRNGNYI